MDHTGGIFENKLFRSYFAFSGLKNTLHNYNFAKSAYVRSCYTIILIATKYLK